MTNTPDVWTAHRKRERIGHPAPFPVELPHDRSSSTHIGVTWFSTHSRSGSTLVAAKQLGRQFIGVDLDDDYVALARQRVADEGDEVDLAVDGRSGRTSLTIRQKLALVRSSSGESQALASGCRQPAMVNMSWLSRVGRLVVNAGR